MDLIINNINYSNLPDNIKLEINNINIYHNNTVFNINQYLSNNQINNVYNILLESLDHYNRLKNNINNINIYNLPNNETFFNTNKSIKYEYINIINNLLNKYIFELDKIFIDNFMSNKQ